MGIEPDVIFCQPERQPCFAYSAGTGEGHQTAVRGGKQLGEFVQLGFATLQRVRAR